MNSPIRKKSYILNIKLKYNYIFQILIFLTYSLYSNYKVFNLIFFYKKRLNNLYLITLLCIKFENNFYLKKFIFN